MPIYLCVLVLCMFIVINCIIAFGLRWATKIAKGSDNTEGYRGLRKIILTTRTPGIASFMFTSVWIAASGPISAEIGEQAFGVGVILSVASFFALMVSLIQAQTLLRSNIAKFA